MRGGLKGRSLHCRANFEPPEPPPGFQSTLLMELDAPVMLRGEPVMELYTGNQLSIKEKKLFLHRIYPVRIASLLSVK